MPTIRRLPAVSSQMHSSLTSSATPLANGYCSQGFRRWLRRTRTEIANSAAATKPSAMSVSPPFFTRKFGMVSVLGAAVAAVALWLWVYWCIFPVSVWNNVRLAPAFALARGLPPVTTQAGILAIALIWAGQTPSINQGRSSRNSPSSDFP